MRNAIRQLKPTTLGVLGTLEVLLLASCTPQPETAQARAMRQSPFSAGELHPATGNGLRHE